MSIQFTEYEMQRPTYEGVAAEYDEIVAELETASSGEEAIAAVAKWDAVRQRLTSWSVLVEIRYHQDTRNEEYKQTLEYRDELQPKLTDLAVQMKRRLLNCEHRDALAERFGTHVFDLWQCDLAAFDPAIEKDLVEEAKLDAEYHALLATAKFEFEGETLNLSEILKYDERPERELRHEAAQLRWGWFAEHQQQIDTIFDKLVQLRQTMAEKLGFENFIGLGYQRMHRVDYDQAMVERFRESVRESVVPVVVEIRKQQSQRIGVEPLMAWDLGLFDRQGNPQPQGDHDWMIQQATTMFAELGGGMDDLFGQMRTCMMMDLKSREGKAGGGFCGTLAELEMPFIFANFNGTMQDVRVFTHEMGHAYQLYCSRQQPIEEYLWATCETCEVHSMGLEFLSWPQMELFFGEEAERFRRNHLAQLLIILPYIVAIDHFQHLVYANPSSTADERAEMWQDMEQIYLPGLDWGDLEHPASGRRWQAQQHLFGSPFYYIDYGLALTCALQLWVRAEEDREGTMAEYVRLCRRGGEAAFGKLVKEAGLISPFETGCLEQVAEQARSELI